MMERKRAFRSGIVLLELMASILIFALAGAVCVQVLMKADALATQAQNLTDGVNYASSAAEMIRSAGSNGEAVERLQEAWPETRLGENVQIPFDQGMLEITIRNDQGLWNYSLHWLASDGTTYDLTVCRSDPEVTP